MVKQSFIDAGDKRGDQVAILDGVKKGDTVVTSGQNKLKNNTPVEINNAVTISNQASPEPVDE